MDPKTNLLHTLSMFSSPHHCTNLCTLVGKDTAPGSLRGWHPASHGPRMPVQHQCTSLWPSEGFLCVLSHTPSCSLRVLWTEGVGDWVLHSHSFPGEPSPVLQKSFTQMVQITTSEACESWWCMHVCVHTTKAAFSSHTTENKLGP